MVKYQLCLSLLNRRTPDDGEDFPVYFYTFFAKNRPRILGNPFVSICR